MSLYMKRCDDCGSRLSPCPARWDGEDTFVGFYRCECREAREEDAERAEEMDDLLGWRFVQPTVPA